MIASLFFCYFFQNLSTFFFPSVDVLALIFHTQGITVFIFLSEKVEKFCYEGVLCGDVKVMINCCLRGGQRRRKISLEERVILVKPTGLKSERGGGGGERRTSLSTEFKSATIFIRDFCFTQGCNTLEKSERFRT